MVDDLKEAEKELEKDILAKLEVIRENILTGKGQNGPVRLSMLSMVADELSDVLLNFDSGFLQSNFDTD